MAEGKRFSHIFEKAEKLNQQYTNNGCFYWLDYVCAFLLAVCPLLQHYVGPLYSAGISVLALVAVYLICRIALDWSNIDFSKIVFVLPMIVYQIYRAVNHGTTVTEFGQSGVFVIFMLGVALGKINVRLVVRFAQMVGLTASVCLIIQYFCFYILGFHLQFVPTSLLIPSAEQWILCAQTGLAGVTGRIGNFYRPSAFFLEPSHVYIYMFPHVILQLFEGKLTKTKFWQAVLMSVGILGTTSGMGIAAVAGIWGLFLILWNEEDGSFRLKNAFRKRNLITVAIFVIIFALAVIYVPFLNRAVKRIFVPGKTGSTAISGRTKQAMNTILAMSVKQWIFGVADNTHGIPFTFPGVLDVLYRHGLIGLILSYELYVKCILKQKFSYQFIGAAILVTSLFTGHTHSTVGMLNYLLILMCGFQDMESERNPIQVYVPLKKPDRKKKQG